MKTPIFRRVMSPDENLAVEQMQCVTYPVGSWDKRFMRNLSSGDCISEKESAQLWRIFTKYRRQMNFPAKARLLKFAETHAAPDFRKVEAARKDQERINILKQKIEELKQMI